MIVYRDKLLLCAKLKTIHSTALLSVHVANMIMVKIMMTMFATCTHVQTVELKITSSR